MSKLQRCITRISSNINKAKWDKVQSTIVAYNQEKQYWLNELQRKENIIYINQFRKFRDSALRSGYQSKYGLQGRSWKLALNDACEMMDKYWLSIIERLKSELYKNANFNNDQLHYANYILKNNYGLYERLKLVLENKLVEFDKNQLEIKFKYQVIKYLCRKIKQVRKNYPKVKLKRSMVLDANMYDVMEANGKQHLSLMSLEKGKRIRVPLLGNTRGKLVKDGKMYFGNIRVVILNNRTLQMHYSSEVSEKECTSTSEIIGLDLGYSEVFVDNHNQIYGDDFGKILQNKSDQLKLKNQKRNKLYALEKKYIAQGKIKKARNIRKSNLGRIKYDRLINRQNANSKRIVNQAINELTTNYESSTIVTENLNQPIRKKVGKNWNRRLSSWIKGFIKERIEFKALAKGFSHKPVNAAYTSQTCPVCSYVDKRNRKQDKFECLHCRHVGHSDHVAAMNIANRYLDLEITIFTPYQKVKQILLARFHRGLETEQSGTVTHRTREALETMLNP